MDLFFILVTVAFFAATGALCALFDRIRRRT
ncbi:hypothetical protein GGR36_001002 [Niveibacterium umoris]|uniref:Uncharacterized protein n=1 Tax=Niveibacterium umoris TaxID=1193620 RepID=A0A840BHG3_9RHOO|nr:hypothetical protein [Niveibacterium umoris]